jgi:hypothetical protein
MHAAMRLDTVAAHVAPAAAPAALSTACVPPL